MTCMGPKIYQAQHNQVETTIAELNDWIQVRLRCLVAIIYDRSSLVQISF